jgi:hypothetical protein
LNIDKGFFSRQIKSLENRLEFKIFKTKKSPVKLTDAGNEFLTVARQILNQFEQRFELCQQLNRAEKEQINIGINISIANSLLPAFKTCATAMGCTPPEAIANSGKVRDTIFWSAVNTGVVTIPTYP